MPRRVPPIQVAVDATEHAVLHWYAGHTGVPVARLLKDRGLNDVLTDARTAARLAGFVVPVSAEIVARQQDRSAA